MDPAGTLLSLAQIAIIIDDFCNAYSEAPRTLNSIRLQMKVLEGSIQRVQEWLHYTDPTSKAQIMESLQDATSTVDSAMADLRGDLEEIMSTGPKTSKMLGRQGSDSWMKTKYAWNESRLRRHVTDLRECASLMHFTLAVCQLPLGRAADQEIKELGIGARRLSRAHKSTRSARRPVLTQRQYEDPAEQSADFKAFMDAVLCAEADLPDQSPEDTPTLCSRSPELSPEPLSFVPRPMSPKQDIDDLSKPDLARLTDEPDWRSKKPMPPADELFFASSKQVAVSEIQPAHSMPVLRGGMTSPDNPLPEVVTGQNPFASHTTATPPPLPPRLPLEEKPPPLPDRKLYQQTAQSQNKVAVPIAADPATMLHSPPSVLSSYKPITRKLIQLASRPGLPRTPSRVVSESTKPFEKSPMIDGDIMLTERPAYGSLTTKSSSQTSMSSPPAIWSPDSFPAHGASSTDHLEAESPPPYANTGARLAQASMLSLSQDPRLSAVTSDRRVSLLQRVATDTKVPTDIDCPILLRAVKENREDIVRNLADKVAGLEEIEPGTQRTAIIEAARLARRDICRHLIKAGSRLDAKDSESWTALHVAAARGDSLICRMLLDAGAQLEEYDRKGRTPLQVAAEAGQSEAVLCLLERTPRHGTNDPTLLKAFYESVRRGNLRTAQEFLAHDIKPQKLKDPWKLIAHASQSGNLRMLEFVLEQKVPLKQKSPDGWTALHFAARHGRYAMVEKLLDMKLPWKAHTKKTKETALHLAVLHQQQDTALTLIRHKDANVAIADADGQEALHHAVRNGSVELVTELLSQGAKLKTQNDYGWRPIHLAAAYGHTALVSLFLTHGADLAATLHSPSFKPAKKTNEAARKGYWAEIRWPHEGATALQLAIEFGHSEVAKMLLAAGAKIEDSDAQRWRPLHYAAYHCRLEMVESLLDRGASPLATTADGNTPLGLGFREYGVTESQNDRERIQQVLQAAASNSKKSAFKSMVEYRMGGPKSRTARERNLAWHTAEIADGLYKYHGVEDGEEDEESMYELASSTSGSVILELESTISLASDTVEYPGMSERRVSSLAVEKS